MHPANSCTMRKQKNPKRLKLERSIKIAHASLSIFLVNFRSRPARQVASNGEGERERERRACARTCIYARREFYERDDGATFSQTFYTCGFHSPLRPCDWFGLYESVVWLNARNESRWSNRRWSWHQVARPRPRESDDAAKETDRFIVFREKIRREQICNRHRSNYASG